MAKALKWGDIAAEVGASKEWVTAACLGPMTPTAEQDGVMAELFDLKPEEKRWLMVVPYKGYPPAGVPTDPLIYRIHEMVSVQGTRHEELIHEEFGDDIMSSIDFQMDLRREPNPAGDRVNLVISGRFPSMGTD